MKDDIYSMYFVYNVPKKNNNIDLQPTRFLWEIFPEKKKKNASSRAKVLSHVTFGWGVELEDL